MTAHEYLSMYLALDSDIDRWRREIKKRFDVTTKDSPFSIISNISDMPKSRPNGDRMASFIARHVDADMRGVGLLEEKIREAKEKQLAIIQAVDAVPINLARQVLDFRYLQGVSVQDIADKMESSEKTVRRLIVKGQSWIVFEELSPFVPNCP